MYFAVSFAPSLVREGRAAMCIAKHVLQEQQNGTRQGPPPPLRITGSFDMQAPCYLFNVDLFAQSWLPIGTVGVLHVFSFRKGTKYLRPPLSTSIV